jgi:hypothetical protein
MNNLKYLTMIEESLDSNDIEAAKTILGYLVHYHRLEELKSKPSTYVYPYEPDLSEKLTIKTGPNTLSAWLTEFKKVTNDAEVIIVHPVTWTFLAGLSHDMAKIEIESFMDYPE